MPGHPGPMGERGPLGSVGPTVSTPTPHLHGKCAFDLPESLMRNVLLFAGPSWKQRGERREGTLMLM